MRSNWPLVKVKYVNGHVSLTIEPTELTLEHLDLCPEMGHPRSLKLTWGHQRSFAGNLVIYPDLIFKRSSKVTQCGTKGHLGSPKVTKGHLQEILWSIQIWYLKGHPRSPSVSLKVTWGHQMSSKVICGKSNRSTDHLHVRTHGRYGQDAFRIEMFLKIGWGQTIGQGQICKWSYITYYWTYRVDTWTSWPMSGNRSPEVTKGHLGSPNVICGKSCDLSRFDL
jgi:hypothetical protein